MSILTDELIDAAAKALHCATIGVPHGESTYKECWMCRDKATIAVVATLKTLSTFGTPCVDPRDRRPKVSAELLHQLADEIEQAP